jgi:NAD(P)-dependent dehydrogenase (short-subunit alcohol dehydrogenase family)
MEPNQKTVIVTGASQGIGAGVVQAFLLRGYNIIIFAVERLTAYRSTTAAK